MNGFSVGELCIIYGALLLFCVIGILLLLQGWFFKRTFYKKYTLHAKAKVTDKLGSDMSKPVITYEAEVNDEAITLVSLAVPKNTKTRTFVCEARALSMAKFYLGMGSVYVGMSLLGIVMFTGI